MGLASRLFRITLLLSVLLNLGDAPYLDEILLESSQHETQALEAAALGGEPNTPQSPDPGKHAYPGYQLLLHLYGMVSTDRTPSTPSAAKDAPLQPLALFAPAPPDRIDRPPQGTFYPV